MRVIAISSDLTVGRTMEAVQDSHHNMLTSNSSIMVMMRCNMRAINNTTSSCSNTITLKRAICEVVVIG
jgi:hypothetical protein